MNVREAVSTFRGHRQPRLSIIRHRMWWFGLSGLFIVLSLLGLFVRGLNYSIDFNGGAQLQYPNPRSVSATQVTSVLAKFGRGDAVVQVVGTGSGGSQIVIRTQSLNALGGAPQTQYTLPPTSKAQPASLQEALAELGFSDAKVTTRP